MVKNSMGKEYKSFPVLLYAIPRHVKSYDNTIIGCQNIFRLLSYKLSISQNMVGIAHTFMKVKMYAMYNVLQFTDYS